MIKKIEFLPYSQYHIDAIVSEAGGDPWRLTCVYGEAQVSERFKPWDLLKHIKSSSPLPWLCIGDFNEVLHRSEHSRVQERSYTQIAGFREMVDVCGLYDLGYEGRSWTYEKKVAGGSFCRSIWIGILQHQTGVGVSLCREFVTCRSQLRSTGQYCYAGIRS